MGWIIGGWIVALCWIVVIRGIHAARATFAADQPDDKTAEWHACPYRRERGSCGCNYRCVYEGPEDVPPRPDVPQR